MTSATAQYPSSAGHSSRRDIQSSSSIHSTRSDRSERSAPADSSPVVESAVTRLLVSIKQLLLSLTRWSQLKLDENGVSDVYVRLGNDFNAAVAAFTSFGIDMTELMAVPDDLRGVLEQCLAEDANETNLNNYLPTVRQIITNLLQGLRGKQAMYRKLIAEQGGGSSRSSRSSRTHRTQSSKSETGSERSGDRGSLSRRSAQASRRDPTSPPPPSHRSMTSTSDSSFVGGFAPNLTEGTPKQDYVDLPPQESGHRRRPSMPASLPEESSPSTPDQRPTTPSTLSQAALEDEEVPTTPPSQPVVPASVKRYSLVDKPAPSISVMEPSSPDPDQIPSQNGHHATNGAIHSPPETPPIEDSPTPAVANSLAALERSDTLQRRASKRFSTYNISKITGARSERPMARGASTNRRSMAVSSALTPGELAVLTEVDDEEGSPDARRSITSPRDAMSPPRTRGSRPSTPDRRKAASPFIPPVPSTPARTPEPPAEDVVKEVPSPDGKVTVFLQVGREVKKVSIEPGLSVSSLRVLFVDKFSYNPGLENFPAIYIRDPSSGVQYELEDMDEVQERCLLSLNIEPLDQIKQHIDSQMTALSQDIRDLRLAVGKDHRQSGLQTFDSSSPFSENASSARPTDRQFKNAARRLSQLINDSGTGSPKPSSGSSSSTTTPASSILLPQMTGASTMTEYSSRVVSDLRTQFDEVQNLRRDIGIMRQLYQGFVKQTKDQLSSVRTQTQSVKKLADSNIGGARAFIDSGKQKLDSRTQNVLTEIEKLQDTVEGIKDDVLKRHISPKPQYLKTIKKDMDAAAAEIASLQEHVGTVKPMWKKTWEEELQNIVEEQQFLQHQEEFLEDLHEDYKALAEIYGHVEKVISLRGGQNGIMARNKGFRPPPMDEGHTGLSTVMLQIKGGAVDTEKRMKAIEASQKHRAKELASRSDEFKSEITDFVGQKRLKMTGGAEETERVRQKRNEQTLKAMFTGNSSMSSDY